MNTLELYFVIVAALLTARILQLIASRVNAALRGSPHRGVAYCGQAGGNGLSVGRRPS